MAKDSYYFSHDFNARNDEKILELRSAYGAEGYGVFWMIVETMAENDNGGINSKLIGGLSLGYGVAIGRLSEIIQACITTGLFYEKDGYYFSNRLLAYKEFRKNLTEFGKQGAAARWGGYRGANGGGNAKERKRKERNRGIEFSADNLSVIFPDHTEQKLGDGQLAELQRKNLSPASVYKGHAY